MCGHCRQLALSHWSRSELSEEIEQRTGGRQLVLGKPSAADRGSVVRNACMNSNSMHRKASMCCAGNDHGTCTSGLLLPDPAYLTLQVQASLLVLVAVSDLRVSRHTLTGSLRCLRWLDRDLSCSCSRAALHMDCFDLLYGTATFDTCTACAWLQGCGLATSAAQQQSSCIHRANDRHEQAWEVTCPEPWSWLQRPLSS